MSIAEEFCTTWLKPCHPARPHQDSCVTRGPSLAQEAVASSGPLVSAEPGPSTDCQMNCGVWILPIFA